MKKLIYLITPILLMMGQSLNAQCVQTCSNYFVAPVTYSFENVGGISLPLGDDELSSPVPIGFNFNFMCSTYSEVVVSSNGFMTFDIFAFDAGCCSGQPIPNLGSTPNDMVAFTWNDLYLPGGGSITYTTIGVSPNQVFVLTYSDVPHCCGTPTPNNTGQIKLFEFDQSIEIHTALITNDGSTSTQGIEDATGGIAVPAPGANGTLYTATNTAYRWSNNIPTPPISISGPTAVCTGIANNFSVAPMPGATSYSWALPGGWTGTSTTNIIPAMAGAAGDLSVVAIYTCGASLSTTMAVSVIGSPTVSITGNTTSICPAATISLSANGADTYSWNTGALTSSIAPNPTTNITYTVIGTSSITGCTGNAVTTVSVYPSPSVSAAGSGTICLGQSQSLASNGGVSYTWQPGNLTGFLVSVSPTVTTNYTVTGTSANGCTNTANASVSVTLCATGLNNQSASINNLSVFPNPNNGEFTVELKNGLSKTIEITDYTGKTVLTTVTAKDSININLSNMASGIYFVKVQSKNSFEVLKIVKQ